jgi:hypothetical protein
MTFTAEEFDTFHGPWNPARIELVRAYCNEPTGCWTPKEAIVTKFLLDALNWLHEQDKPVVQP